MDVIFGSRCVYFISSTGVVDESELDWYYGWEYWFYGSYTFFGSAEFELEDRNDLLNISYTLSLF